MLMHSVSLVKLANSQKKLDIEFQPHEPFCMKSYPVAQNYKAMVEKEVKRLKPMGILEDV